jgi:hypothetical protein
LLFERAGIRQEKCRGIHRVGKSGVSVWDGSNKYELSIINAQRKEQANS